MTRNIKISCFSGDSIARRKSSLYFLSEIAGKICYNIICIYEDYGGKPVKIFGNIGTFAYLTKTIGALGDHKRKIESLKAQGKTEEEILSGGKQKQIKSYVILQTRKPQTGHQG